MLALKETGLQMRDGIVDHLYREKDREEQSRRKDVVSYILNGDWEKLTYTVVDPVYLSKHT